MLKESTPKIKAKLQELYTLINKEAAGKGKEIIDSLQEKFSNQIAQKDELIEKTADSLIGVVNKLRNSLRSK